MTPTAATEPACREGLAQILAPVTAEEFLTHDLGKRFRHVPGESEKFAALLPWDVLNRILEQHRLEPPRLRLTREGKPVASESFLSYTSNTRNTSRIPRLNAAALTAQLRSGATLVLDAVDELHPPIRAVAESLERVFRVRVQVNAYAGWRTSHGFDLHWDDHDVFVLQVAGRKHWKVYGMTRAFPLARDTEPTTEPPSEVLWDNLLCAGDLLYIPRGWWHVATPLDEPTVHLTVGVNHPTGADFLAWFADRLRVHEHVRRDLPHLEAPNAMRAHADALREAILNAWNADLLDAYLRDLDSKSRPRPQLGLPWTATAQVIPDGSFAVRWTGTRALALKEVAGEITVDANGRRWKFAPEARGLLEMLLTGDDYSIELLENLSPQARAFVKELVREGLLTLVQ